MEQTIFFIDQDMAAKIRKLSHEDLDYALSDVLTENQLRLTKERLDGLQNHLEKNMVEIKPDGWDLKEYSIHTPASELDERGKKYVKALKNLDAAFEDNMGLNHKYYYAKVALQPMKEEFTRQEKQAQWIAEGMAAMFEEEPEKEAREPIKEARAQEKQAQEAKKEAPPLPQKRRTSFQDLQKRAAEEKLVSGKESQEKAPWDKRESLIGRPGKAVQPVQEKKEEQPHRVRTNFLSMTGRNAPQRRTSAMAGGQEKQAERQKQSGRVMG